MEWEMVFANRISDKGLKSRTNDELQLNNRQANNLIFKGAKDVNSYFLLFFSLSVMSNSLQTNGLQPIRLLCLWDFPGKNM